MERFCPRTGIGIVIAAAVLAGAPPSQGLEGEQPVLRILAAASLTEVTGALATSFAGGAAEVSVGGSGALARQIRDGVPADVFLSASADWIDYLRESDSFSGEPVVFARNRLVCVAPPAAAGRPRLDVADPRDLPRELTRSARVAVADPGVPAGEYARAALQQLGILADLERRLAGQKDVRAVLHVVERGELEAGFVYATDAKLSTVQVLFAFDPATHPPIDYHAVALSGSPNPASARRFLEFLRSDDARNVLVAAGFEVP